MTSDSKKIRILVTGSKGQLGFELMRQGNEKGHDMNGFDIPELDISDKNKTINLIGAGSFDIVINAAAYTAVDLAESEPEKAEQANSEGPAYIAEACSKAGIPIVHISTDYVFDGSKKGAYTEEDPVAPLGVYGRTKLAGEKAVADRLSRHIIVRTAWVYGIHGKNFVKTMLNLGREREELRIVSDQIGCPTCSSDLAAALLVAAEKALGENSHEIWGVYNYCGRGQVSWHGFAEAIFEMASKFESLRIRKVIAIPASEYQAPAARPANSTLDCRKFSEIFGVSIPDWRTSLESMIKELYSFNKKTA